MTSNTKSIRSFIKNIVNGNYKDAHVDLKRVVENKMKQKIKIASKKRIY